MRTANIALPMVQRSCCSIPMSKAIPPCAHLMGCCSCHATIYSARNCKGGQHDRRTRNAANSSPAQLLSRIDEGARGADGKGGHPLKASRPVPPGQSPLLHFTELA